MKDLYEDLHGACEVMSRELGEMVDKVEQAGGKMSAGDLEVLDKLTHGIKSIKTTMAMMDADGYSEGSYARRGRAYGDGYGSYARRRDGMGRFTRHYDEDMDRR